MNNSEAPLTLLRKSVANLDQYEKLALAAFLVGTSNSKFPGFKMPEDGTVGDNLTKACDLARQFPSATKIFFAIELLELQIDRDEFEEEGEEDDDGLPDPDDYDDADIDPYGYSIPALDEED